MSKKLVTTRTKIEQRLIVMLKQTMDWYPEDENEEHDKKIVLRTIRYALTGKAKLQKVKSE